MFRAASLRDAEKGILDPQRPPWSALFRRSDFRARGNVGVGASSTWRCRGKTRAARAHEVVGMCRQAGSPIHYRGLLVYAGECANSARAAGRLGMGMVRSGNIRVGVVVWFPAPFVDYDALHALGCIQGAEPFYSGIKNCDSKAPTRQPAGTVFVRRLLRGGAIARFSLYDKKWRPLRGWRLGPRHMQRLSVSDRSTILDGALLRNVELMFICHPRVLW